MVFGCTCGLLPRGANQSSSCLLLCFQSCWGKLFPVPWSSVVSEFVFVFLTVMDAMGRMTSSPLDVLFTPCVEVNMRARKLSVLMKKSKLVIFCRLGWPAFNVGWSPGGSFDLAIIRAEEEIVFRPWLGHPNQVPYKVIWRDLV